MEDEGQVFGSSASRVVSADLSQWDGVLGLGARGDETSKDVALKALQLIEDYQEPYVEALQYLEHAAQEWRDKVCGYLDHVINLRGESAFAPRAVARELLKGLPAIESLAMGRDQDSLRLSREGVISKPPSFFDYSHERAISLLEGSIEYSQTRRCFSNPMAELLPGSTDRRFLFPLGSGGSWSVVDFDGGDRILGAGTWCVRTIDPAWAGCEVLEEIARLHREALAIVDEDEDAAGALWRQRARAIHSLSWVTYDRKNETVVRPIFDVWES